MRCGEVVQVPCILPGTNADTHHLYLFPYCDFPLITRDSYAHRLSLYSTALLSFPIGRSLLALNTLAFLEICESFLKTSNKPFEQSNLANHLTHRSEVSRGSLAVGSLGKRSPQSSHVSLELYNSDRPGTYRLSLDPITEQSFRSLSVYTIETLSVTLISSS